MVTKVMFPFTSAGTDIHGSINCFNLPATFISTFEEKFDECFSERCGKESIQGWVDTGISVRRTWLPICKRTKVMLVKEFYTRILIISPPGFKECEP